jgi:hypothetical protein
MRKYIFTVLVCLLATFKIKAAFADYPFTEDCRNEINEYCSNIGYDLSECLAEHKEILGQSCVNAIDDYESDMWGGYDQDLDRRVYMNSGERHDFHNGHHEGFDHHEHNEHHEGLEHHSPGGMHGGMHGGGLRR